MRLAKQRVRFQFHPLFNGPKRAVITPSHHPIQPLPRNSHHLRPFMNLQRSPREPPTSYFNHLLSLNPPRALASSSTDHVILITYRCSVDPRLCILYHHHQRNEPMTSKRRLMRSKLFCDDCDRRCLEYYGTILRQDYQRIRLAWMNHCGDRLRRFSLI